MATWVIGDIHGCWRTLTKLLQTIEWEPECDQLWLVGDLVNRGPSSLEVLRWASENRERVNPVLGNHDLHVLARSIGVAKERNEDTLEEIMRAPDRNELLAWMRTWPLLHHFGPYVMVHAGLLPEWNIEIAIHLADEVSAGIAGPDGDAIIGMVYARRKEPWHEGLRGVEQLASAAAIFTRMRMVGPDGRAELSFKDAPGSAPASWQPWFRASAARHQGYRMLFGHWAHFGFYRANEVTCLDSGCVYGGRLSAVRLEDGRVVQEPVADKVAGTV